MPHQTWWVTCAVCRKKKKTVTKKLSTGSLTDFRNKLSALDSLPRSLPCFAGGLGVPLLTCVVLTWPQPFLHCFEIICHVLFCTPGPGCEFLVHKSLSYYLCLSAHSPCQSGKYFLPSAFISTSTIEHKFKWEVKILVSEIRAWCRILPAILSAWHITYS